MSHQYMCGRMFKYWTYVSMSTCFPLCLGIGQSISHYVCASVCACSLLAQVSGHITAFEALEVIEALGQPLGGLTVGSAAIGQSVGAATLQTLQTAQIALVWVRQHVCEVGIAGEENIHTHTKTHMQVDRLMKGTHVHCYMPTHLKWDRANRTDEQKTQLHKHMFAYTQTKSQMRFKWLVMPLTQFQHHLMSYFNAVNLKADYNSEAAFTCPDLFQKTQLISHA